MKTPRVEYTMDLFDDFPDDLREEWWEKNREGYSNGSYTYFEVNSKSEDTLEKWLVEEGYPLGARILVKISW